MNKRLLIEDIRKYNTTVAPGFLAQFEEEALEQYLNNLKAARNKRVMISPAVRAAGKSESAIAA